MLLYIWRNYVSNDEDTMSEKIFDLLCEDCHDIGYVEAQVEAQWDNVETEEASLMGVFQLMKDGYIFIEHIGKE